MSLDNNDSKDGNVIIPAMSVLIYLSISMVCFYMGIFVFVKELFFYRRQEWHLDSESTHWVWRFLDAPSTYKDVLSPFITRFLTLVLFLFGFILMTVLPMVYAAGSANSNV